MLSYFRSTETLLKIRDDIVLVERNFLVLFQGEFNYRKNIARILALRIYKYPDLY